MREVNTPSLGSGTVVSSPYRVLSTQLSHSHRSQLVRHGKAPAGVTSRRLLPRRGNGFFEATFSRRALRKGFPCMKRSSILLAGVAFFALTAGGALADCTGEIAQLSPGTTTGSVSGSSGGHPGISKD